VAAEALPATDVAALLAAAANASAFGGAGNTNDLGRPPGWQNAIDNDLTGTLHSHLAACFSKAESCTDSIVECRMEAPSYDLNIRAARWSMLPQR
jgi:hypothetical protein